MSDNTEQQAVGGEERRDWDAYFLMNTVHLLRTLKVMDSLTPIQHKLVEEHCKLRAATVRQDIDQLISRHYIAKEAAIEVLAGHNRIHYNVDRRKGGTCISTSSLKVLLLTLNLDTNPSQKVPQS